MCVFNSATGFQLHCKHRNIYFILYNIIAIKISLFFFLSVGFVHRPIEFKLAPGFIDVLFTVWTCRFLPTVLHFKRKCVRVSERGGYLCSVDERLIYIRAEANPPSIQQGDPTLRYQIQPCRPPALDTGLRHDNPSTLRTKMTLSEGSPLITLPLRLK